MKNEKLSNLAVNGGAKTIEKPFPGRSHFGIEEKTAVNKLFDDAIKSGSAPGYNGPEEEAYCREFAEYMGGGYADGVNSGTNSVYVALKALNPEPFSEIIVSCITDPGGMMPIPLLNCIPVVADTAPGQYNTSAAEIEKLITPLTSVIVVPHIGGEPADIKGIMKVASKYDIQVVEDCSQSHGAKINGEMIGTFGDIAAYSTMFGKHHCAGGQGGMIFTKSEGLYWKIRRAADRGKPFGMPSGTTNCTAALNNNLSEISSAIGREQLKKLPSIVSRRQEFAAVFKKKCLNDLKSIKVPELLSGAEDSYWWWRLEVNQDAISCSKADFCAALSAEGVSLNPSYIFAMPHKMDWFKNRSAFGTRGFPWTSPLYKGSMDREFDCPNAENACSLQFNLNIAESWGEKEIELLSRAFKKVETAFLK
ncbi:MAG: hypothetical protein A2020_13165 [Lentisphaerae bacterium GWF2_45_14]|nr:MAG: hypothetical protein A2020_13165 [Lentisphaerae bacterium GWF2_45_14]